MSTKLNRPAYQQRIDENIAWLEKVAPDTLERRHTIQVLRHSVLYAYDLEPIVEVVANDDCVTDAIMGYRCHWCKAFIRSDQDDTEMKHTPDCQAGAVPSASLRIAR